MATSGRSAGHISRETTNPGKSHFPGSHISREAGMGSAFYMGDGKDSVGSSIATAAADVASLSSFSSSTTNSNSSASDAVTVAFPGKAVRVVEGSVNGNLKPSSADVEAVGSLVASISTQSSSSEGESIPIIDISGDEPEVELVYFKSCTYAEAAAKGKAKQGRPVNTAAALKAGNKRTSPKANSLKSQTTCETTNSTTAKGPSPNKKQKRLKSTPSLGPDDFNLEAVVGKGGFGQVFLVSPRDSAHGKLNLVRGGSYALKCVRKSKVVCNKTEWIHLQTELRVLNLLRRRSPFVVEMVASFQNGSHVFILTEFVPGGELFNVINILGGGGQVGGDEESGERGIPERQARFYMAEIALALGFLHSLEIMYRDMKPENVMIALDGHVKLIDFGLSKDRFYGVNKGTYCGTKEYMAPEVARREPYGVAADWWSFGALSFDVMCNKYPYGDRPTLIDHASQTVKYPAYLTARAVRLLMKLMCVDPKKRMRTQAEVTSDPFFFEVGDWAAVAQKRLAPPFIPALPRGRRHNPGYFDLEVTKGSVKLEAEDDDGDNIDYGDFPNFDYLSDDAAATLRSK